MEKIAEKFAEKAAVSCGKFLMGKLLWRKEVSKGSNWILSVVELEKASSGGFSTKKALKGSDSKSFVEVETSK
jgi:hypothetical protein